MVEGGADAGVGEQAVDDVRDRFLVGGGQAAGLGDPLGEPGRAREAVRASLDRLGDREDLAAERFRGFVSELEERLDDVG